MKGLNEIPGFRCRVPAGAFYAFPNVSGTGVPSKQLADLLLYEAGVACLDGNWFPDRFYHHASWHEQQRLHPCMGDVRRVILDHLGNRYRRTFGDVWEFVRFAREQNLDLDFTTPPQRPESAATAKR